MDYIKKIKNKSILLLISISAFYLATLIISDFTDLISRLNTVNWSYYPIIFGLSFLIIVIKWFRYHLILKKLNIKMNPKDSFLVYVAGFSMIITPGGSGEIIRSQIIKTKTGKSISITSPMFFFEKWLDFSSFIIAIGFLLIWENYVESKIVFIIGVSISILILMLMKKTIGINIINKVISKLKFIKIGINSEEFQDSTNKLITVRTLFETFFLTILATIVSIVIAFLVFQSFNINFNLFQSGQIFITSITLGSLSFIPGGLIVTESGLLGLMLKYGIDFETSSVSVIVLRFVTLWFVSIIGFISLKIISKKSLNKIK